MNTASKSNSFRQAVGSTVFGPMIRRILKLFRGKANHGKFWTQKINVKQFYDRKDYFFPICQRQKVIHFGCTDYPVFKPHSNLHIQLSTITKELHGFDIDLNGIEELKRYVNQPFFSSYDELKNKHYDICLVPETIEHVDNIREFLENLRHVNAEVFIITGPNCFCQENIKRNSFKDGVFNEIRRVPDDRRLVQPIHTKKRDREVFPLNSQAGLFVGERYNGVLRSRKKE